MSNSGFKRGTTLVVGDVMLDRYWHGATSRISPEAPVPVVKVQVKEDRPGGAANVALNIATLQGKVLLLGLVGDDEPAATLEQNLRAAQVDCNFVSIKGMQTISKLRILSRHQQLIRLDFEQNFKQVASSEFKQKYQLLLPQVDSVVLSDYDKGALKNIPELINFAIAKQKAVFIDPKGEDFSKYRKATLITPNQQEFDAVVGASLSEKEFFKKAEQLRAALELQALLVTRSDKGMVLFEAGHKPFVQAARAKDVYDVTGAGDTVIAVAAAASSAKMNLREATQIANYAAGIVVGKVGTATASLDELQQFWHAEPQMSDKVLSLKELVLKVKQAQREGEKVVFTNGCFDILHAGHVQYLQQAKALGHKLVIGVNSDKSVAELKGESRPINKLQNRLAVLAALDSVDWLVPFAANTPQQLITACLPDVLVKGGDYQKDEIVGAKEVIESGGEVVVLDFLEGCSTSNIIEKIQGN